MSETLLGILFLVYMLAAWWAVNKIWYSRHTYIVSDTMVFYFKKGFLALMLGWAAIPIAIIMTLVQK